MIEEKEFTAKHVELLELMSGISEDCHDAGWITGNEYAIWSALQDGNLRFGRGEMDADQLERCRTLSEELGGWMIWLDDDIDPELPAEAWGPRFVPMAQWLQMAGTANAPAET